MKTKENILIFLGSFHPHEDAITNVILPLITSLQEDYEVDIYTRNPKGDAPLQEEYMGFHVYRDRIYDHDKEKREKQIALTTKRDTNLTITDHRMLALKKIYSFFMNIPSDRQWQARLNKNGVWYQGFRELIRSKNYRAVLTVSSPIQAQTEALKLAKEGYFKKHDIIWIPYYVDPFATYIRNTQNRNFPYFLEFETEVYQYADAVFTSPELYDENHKYPMGKYIEKTIPVQFASMKEQKKYAFPSFMNPEDINVVYTGSLFDHTIRKPDTFFAIASQLPENIQVHIACNLTNPIVEDLKKKYLDNHKNIHWHGTMPIETCFAMMANADVLINLGNESENQTPSKVFDYIGMHRPIASFYSLENDTSLKYLKDYPYLIKIRNEEPVSQETVQRFIAFANQTKSMHIDDALIEQNYHQYQSKELAKQFKEKFNRIVREKQKR